MQLYTLRIKSDRGSDHDFVRDGLTQDMVKAALNYYFQNINKPENKVFPVLQVTSTLRTQED